MRPSITTLTTSTSAVLALERVEKLREYRFLFLKVAVVSASLVI